MSCSRWERVLQTPSPSMHPVDLRFLFHVGTKTLATLLLNESQSLLSSQCDLPTLSLYLDIWLHFSKFHSLYSLPALPLPTCLHLFHASLDASDPSFPLASHFLDALALALLRTILADISDPSPDIGGSPDLSLPPRALFQTLAISVNEATPATWLELAAMLLLSVGDSYDIHSDPRVDELKTALRQVRESPAGATGRERLVVIRGLCVLAGRSAGVRGEVEALGERRREVERERGVWRGQRRRAKRDIQSVFLEAKRRRRETEGEMAGKEVRGEGDSVIGEKEGKSMVEKMEGKSVVEKMEGKSMVEKMEGKSVVEKMEGKSVVEKMEGKPVVEKMEGKPLAKEESPMSRESTDPQLAGKPSSDPMTEIPATSLSPEQQSLLHSLQLAIRARDLPRCNVLPRGSSHIVALRTSSLDETPLRSQANPASCGTCAIIAPSGGIGATLAVADGSRQGRKSLLGHRDGKSALFRTAGK